MIKPLDPIAHHGKYRGQRTRSNHTTATQSTNPSYRWGRWLAHGPTVSVGWDLNPSSWTQYSPETTWEARESTAGLPEGGTRNQNSSEQGGWFLCKGQVPWPCSLKASFRLPRLVPSSNSWDTEYCWPRLRLMLSLVQSDVIRGMFLGKRAQLFPHRDHRVKKKRWPGCLQIRMCSRDSMTNLS